jgi:protein-S-isoprenylcysteine O-methyltransferase Ste14
MSALGSFLFVFLFLLRIEQGLHGSFAAWLLAVQSGLTAFRLIFRKKAKNDSPLALQAMAWLSSLAPLAMVSLGSPLWEIPGLALSVWALLALGDAFSISPSDRGLVQYGPYRFIRHPMYAGELLSLIGTCVSNPMFWNWSVLAIFVLSVYMRIVEEESVIEGYYRYTRVVAWRLVPHVW